MFLHFVEFGVRAFCKSSYGTEVVYTVESTSTDAKAAIDAVLNLTNFAELVRGQLNGTPGHTAAGNLELGSDLEGAALDETEFKQKIADVILELTGTKSKQFRIWFSHPF